MVHTGGSHSCVHLVGRELTKTANLNFWIPSWTMNDPQRWISSTGSPRGPRKSKTTNLLLWISLWSMNGPQRWNSSRGLLLGHDLSTGPRRRISCPILAVQHRVRTFSLIVTGPQPRLCLEYNVVFARWMCDLPTHRHRD